jgi:hypothetical protein
MNLSRITFGIAATAIVVTGCSGDVTAADADDALAFDSTLSLQVLSAKCDSVPAVGEPQYVVRAPEPRPTDLDVAVAPVKVMPPQRSVAAVPVPTAPRTAPRVVAAPATSPPKPATVKSPEPPPVTTTRRTPLRSTATIPAGTRLSLVSSSRVCVTSSDVGDRIPARTASRLTGPVGTVIPSGARATGVITSLTGPLGEEQIAFDIRWITVGGTSYRVSTRVTDFQLDRKPGAERCMPAGAEIQAVLTEGVRIRMQ